MTSIALISRGKYFANRKPYDSADLLIAHDDNSDGTAISLTLNHHWRKLLASVLSDYLNGATVDFEDTDNADRDDNVGAFWDDFML